MLAIYVKYPPARSLNIDTSANNGSGLIRLVIPNHQIKNGDTVYVYAITEQPQVHYYYTVTVINANTIDLNDSVWMPDNVPGPPDSFEGLVDTFEGHIGPVGFRKLDLFKDEPMEFISKVSDITKLDKVYSDFSNSFSVPATANNNEIFRYYYNVDVTQKYSYNPNIKVECYLEIDTRPYRFAVLQLESVRSKNNRVDSYIIGLFSSIIQLTDVFGEDKLSELDHAKSVGEEEPNGLKMYDYDNTSINFYYSISYQDFNSGATLTPMINYSDKKWSVSVTPDVLGDINITDTATPIKSENTRPSFRLIRIIEAIEKKYKIQFSRDFFGRAEFMNLFMWLNRSQTFTNTEYGHMVITQALLQVIGDGTSITLTPEGDISVIYPNTLTISEDTFSSGYGKVLYTITPAAGYTTRPYTVRVIDQNGAVIGQPKYVSAGGVTKYEANVSGFIKNNPDAKATKIFRLEIKSSSDIVFDIDLNIKTGYRTVTNGNFSDTWFNEKLSINNPITAVTRVVIADNIPDMKVTEFLQNIMKMYKLVIRPLPFTIYEPRTEANKNGKFLITTLNSYYLRGDTLDLTEFVDFSEVVIRKPDVYKEIMFKYLETENVLGKSYKANNEEGIGYGDLKKSYSEDQVNTKTKLEVAVGFENMLFERLLDSEGGATPLMIGESISTDDGGLTFEKNNSKAIVFYNMGISSMYGISPKIQFATGTVQDLAYPTIMGNSNDMLLNQVTQTINFNSGNYDPWHGTTVFPTLFETKWRPWIDEIYDFRQRKFAYKAVNIYPETLTRLDLADTINIKDQRYKIEDFKVNLSTGDATFNLFKSRTPLFLPQQFNPNTFVSSDLNFSDYVSDDKSVVLYGNFTGMFAHPSNQLIKLDTAGNIVTEFNVGTGLSTAQPGYFKDMLKIGNDLYVAGDFAIYNGAAMGRIVKIDYTTGAINATFRTNAGVGFNNTTYGLADAGDGILVCGAFTTYNGITHNRIVKLNYDGTVFAGWSSGSGFNDTATDVTVLGDDSVVVSGLFTTYNGTNATKIVRIQDIGGFIINIGSGIVNTAGTAIGLQQVFDPNPANPSYLLWVYGQITQYRSINVNRLFIIDGLTGTLYNSLFQFSGVNGPILHAKRVLGDKLLIQGEKVGFTTYNGNFMYSLIINTDGSIYHMNNSYYKNFTYNIKDIFYTIELEDKETHFLMDETIPPMNRTSILANAGEMYYGVTMQHKNFWYIDIGDLGDGTSWIQPLNYYGEGFDESTFLIKTKIYDTEPDLFSSRRALIKYNFDDGSYRTVLVQQEGILNVT